MQCMSDYQSIPELPLQFSQPLAANTVIHWFRFDALRLHDNPAFVDAVQTKGIFKAIFIVDLWFNSNYSNRGPNVNVWRFLLEALHDIDSRLQKKALLHSFECLVWSAYFHSFRALSEMEREENHFPIFSNQL